MFCFVTSDEQTAKLPARMIETNLMRREIRQWIESVIADFKR